MRIAINITREQLGGITISNLNLIKHLYGNDVHICGVELNSRRRMKGPVLYRSLDPSLFSHHIINVHDMGIGLVMKKAKSIKDVEKFYADIIKLIMVSLREEKPDVVIVSGTYSLPWLLSIAAARLKIPVVLWYSGILQKEIDGYKDTQKKIFLEMEKSVLKRAEKVIFPSQLCKEEVERVVIKRRLQTESYVIPNAVSHDFIDDLSVNYSVGRNIATVGRYAKVKNIDEFVNIHKRLKKEKWDHSCNIVTNVQRRHIKGIPKSVDVLPPMDIKGLKHFYQSQGLIVCPSVFETFGNVPMEAVCMGIPVLVSKNMGCAEFLKKAGLANMVVDFTEKDIVLSRIKELCGQSILPAQINAIRKMLDPGLVHEEIYSVLRACVQEE